MWSNRITTLGGFSAGGDFLLATGGSGVSVTGPVIAGTLAPGGTISSPNTLEIESTGLLSIAGPVTSGAAGAGLRGGDVILKAFRYSGDFPGSVVIASTGTVTSVLNGAGGTDSIAVTAPTISVAGALLASSDVANGKPGLITLQSDALGIIGTVSAPDGVVAIAPLTLAGLSIDPTVTAGSLSLTPATLGNINVASSATVQGAGRGELVLGGLDGASAVAGTITVNASLALNPAAVPILGLFSSGDIIETAGGQLAVANLEGRAGGNITLGGTGNAIGTIGLTGTAWQPAGTAALEGLTATGGIVLTDGADLHIIGPTGLVSGVGAVSAASLTLSDAGTLLVDGPLGNCGTGALTLIGNSITIGVTTTPTVWSFGAATLSPTADLTLDGGVLNANGIVLSSGSLVQAGGVIASGTSLDLGAQSFIQTAGTAIVAGLVSQSTGSTSIDGTLVAGTADLGAVSLGSPGQISVAHDAGLAALDITGGTLATGGNLTIGSGSGTAGLAGGVASSGSFSQSGGLVLAGGNVAVWSTGAATQSNGTLAANGTLAITAGSLSQGQGGSGAALLSGGAAVRLYATSGDARQGDHGIVASGGTLGSGDGIAIQAPSGDTTFWNFAQAGAISAGVSASQNFVCSGLCSSSGSLIAAGGTAAAGASGGGVADVLLLGGTVDLFANSSSAAPVLSANTLWLFSLGNTTEKPGGVITVATLSGNAGFQGSPTLPGGLAAPAGWTPAAGSNALLGTLAPGGVSTAATISNANLIQTLGSYTTSGTLSVTNAAPTLSVAGPVAATNGATIAASGALLSVTGLLDGGGVLLVANENLTNSGAAVSTAPAAIDIGGTVSAPGGTVALFSETNITETGTLIAATLTGRAGELAGDTALPTNERTNLLGTVNLTGSNSGGTISSNDIGTVSTLLTTGNLTLLDSPVTAGTLTLAGPVVAGYGTLAPASLLVQVGDIGAGAHGALAITGQVAVGNTAATQGSATLTATGNISLTSAIDPATGQTDALVFAPATVTIEPGSGFGTISVANAAATYTQSGGVVASGGIVIGAPGGASIGGDGIIVASAAGVDFAPVIAGTPLASTTTLSSGQIVAAGPSLSPAITFDNLQQSGGTISANGDLLVQGAAAQSAGSILASGNAVIGSGSGTAGHPGSSASGSADSSFAGTLLVGGNIDLWAGGTLTQSGGVLAAGGHVWATANQGIAQTGGTLSAAGTTTADGGIMLLADAGNAAQSAGAVLAAATQLSGATTTPGVIVQAPQGDNDFATVSIAGAVGTPVAATATITCPACAVPLAVPVGNAQVTVAALGGLAVPTLTAQTTTARVDVALLGATVTLDKLLTAGTLSLYSGGNTTETASGTIDALVLQGSAGVGSSGTLALPDALGWAGLPTGWTAGTTGSASLGGIPYPVAVAAAETISNANLIRTLAGYVTTGDFSLTDKLALSVPASGSLSTAAAVVPATGTVLAGGNATLASAGGLSIDGLVTAGNVVLLANENLANSGTVLTAAPATTGIAGTIAATNTLELWAEGNLTETGGIIASLLTGRVGALATDTLLPPNFRATVVSTASLTGSNSIATLGPLLATGDILYRGGSLTVSGPVVADYGALETTGTPTLNLAITGSLDVTGQLAVANTAASAGTAVLTASGDVTLTGTQAATATATGLSSTALVFAPQSVSITANAGSGSYTQTGAVVDSATVTISAGTRQITNGAIAASSIDLSGGSTTLDGGTIIAAGAPAAALTLGTLLLNSGLVETSGVASADSLVQTGGSFVAAGAVTLASYAETGSAARFYGGADVTIGSGSGTAGSWGSQASSGSVDLAQGTLQAAGTLALWSPGTISLANTVIAGTVRATSQTGISQTAGSLTGTQGVFLLSNTGNAAQSGGVVIGGTPGGANVLAPAGADSFGNIVAGGTLAVPASVVVSAPTLACAPCAVPVTAQSGSSITQLPDDASKLAAAVLTLPAPVLTPGSTVEAPGTVTLVGKTITQATGLLLQAGTLDLYATDAISEFGTISVAILAGTAGLAQTADGLSGVNADAVVQIGGFSGNSTTLVEHVGTLGPFTSTGTLDLYNSGSLTIGGNLSAPSIQIGAAGSLAVAGGVTITTGYENISPVPGPQSQPPQDGNGSTGLNLAILNGAGTIDLGPDLTILGIGGAAQQTVRIALPGGGLIQFGTFAAAGTNLLLNVGSGSAVSGSGSIDVAALAAFYTHGSTGSIDLAGTVGSQSGNGAATISRIGQEQSDPAAFSPSTGFVYVPNASYRANKCAITSVNCALILALQTPPPLRQLDTSSILPPEELDDPDLLLPYISDRDD